MIVRNKRVLRDYLVQPYVLQMNFRGPSNREGFLKATYMMTEFGPEARLPEFH